MSNNEGQIKQRIMRWAIPVAFVLMLAAGHIVSATGQPDVFVEQKNVVDQKDKPGEFSPAEMIFHHIVDAHEWHILDHGDFHLSIPLPVILWHEGRLHFFMSGKFKHGYALHKGFGIAHRGYATYIVKADIEKYENDRVIVQDASSPVPLDFSITKTVFAVFISILIMIWVFISVADAYGRRPNKSPKGFQSLIEPVILFVRDEIAKPSLGDKKYLRYMPFLLTTFFFIFLNNLLGLVPIFPGGANVTGNLSITMVLSAFTLLTITIAANRHFWQHIFNTPGVPWMLKLPVPLMPVIELMGLFIKPLVLMIRLFANMLAGHIILLSFISLIFIFGVMEPGFGYLVSPVSVGFTVFIIFIKILVSFIQAFVFTLLSAIYIGMAVEDAH